MKSQEKAFIIKGTKKYKKIPEDKGRTTKIK